MASKVAINQCVGSSAHYRLARSVAATMNCATSSVPAPVIILRHTATVMAILEAA